MKKIRVAVIGAGSFGRNHIRVLRDISDAELAGVFDIDQQKCHQVGQQYGIVSLTSMESVFHAADCAIVATPTVTHETVASALLEAGLDVLVEKPIASSSIAGERLGFLAERQGCILQVGHLERFNPAVTALEAVRTLPLFFEIHRLSLFSARSLDIDVVLDLMIHDLDIVLHITKEQPSEIQAAGISVLSPLVDIANVRLSFPSGCVTNLTASRVSTEKVRKLRLFQPGEYLSVDYGRQEVVRLAVRKNEPNGQFVRQFEGNSLKTGALPEIGFERLAITPGEPLKLELESFLASVRDRTPPRVTAADATNALRVAEAIIVKIREHAHLVSNTVGRYGEQSRFDDQTEHGDQREHGDHLRT
jgi:predicted dehydrogenase